MATLQPPEADLKVGFTVDIGTFPAPFDLKKQIPIVLG